MCDRRNEDGMTLIELLISVVLLGIIIVPLTSAMITGLINTGDAQARLSESRSPLFTSTYFANDAQNADVNGISTAASPVCGSGTNIVSFTWTEDTTQYSASYVKDTSGSTPVLKRYTCTGGTSTGSNTVAPVISGTPTVQCSDAAGNSLSCTVGTAALRRIELDADTSSSPTAEIKFFKLVATRRAT
jgi:prepilin-type N-terminal cleavage/methylation domain-containing protein